MDHLVFIISAIIIVAVLVLGSLFRKKPNTTKRTDSTANYEYESIKALVTPAELFFYRALVVTVKGRHLVFSKVRIADVIRPKKAYTTKALGTKHSIRLQRSIMISSYATLVH